MSRAEGAVWHVQQEESSHPPHLDHGRLDERDRSLEQFARREQTDIHVRLSTHNLSERLGLRGEWRQEIVLKHIDTHLVLEIGLTRPPDLEVGNSSKRGSLPTFSTPSS